MNALRLTFAALLLSLGFVAPLATAEDASTSPAPKANLQVRVTAPFLFDPIYEDEIVDAFYWQIERALIHKDKAFTLEQVDRGEGDPARPILEVTLIQWRTTRMGDVECRFTAEYRTADSKQSLGVFEGNTLSLSRSSGFAARDYERAAEDASRRLRDALRERNLI